MNQAADFQKAEKPLFNMIKRIGDIFLSGLALVCLSPVGLMIAVAVKLQDGGPVIYCHDRIGKDGRPIRVLKFRTMRTASGRVEDCLSPERMEEYRREFKLTDDPRVTKVGQFLRVTSLDELPQFWNILRGDMSLVGPRPLVREELMSKYTEEERGKLLSVKPGLTGLWQVSGRNNCTYQNGQRQKTELAYIARQSFWLDFAILCKTAFVAFSGKGAH